MGRDRVSIEELSIEIIFVNRNCICQWLLKGESLWVLLVEFSEVNYLRFRKIEASGNHEY